jgi:hypothetical protein
METGETAGLFSGGFVPALGLYHSAAGSTLKSERSFNGSQAYLDALGFNSS